MRARIEAPARDARLRRPAGLRDGARDDDPGRQQDRARAGGGRDRGRLRHDLGFQDDLVVPFLGLERDQNLRADTSVEKLAKLKPVFGGEDGTMTAGNSTPLTDGASAVLLASEQWAAERGIPVQAYLLDAE